MLKVYITIVFLNSVAYLYGQEIISSRIFDATNKEPMAYVNIGVKNKNIGTVSSTDGSFKINQNRIISSDSLTFSFVGYNSITVPIVHLLNAKPDSIFMQQKLVELDEITIKGNGKWKARNIGLSRNLPGVYGVVQSDTLSDILECAQQFDLDSNFTKITKFHIYLKGVNTDTASFRINFYHFKENIPGDRVFEKEIFIFRKIENGWMEIDLDEYNIWLKGSIVASIEFLPTEMQKEKISLSYGGILVCKGTSYNRTSSQGEWYRLDFGTYSIYLTTKKFISKN